MINTADGSYYAACRNCKRPISAYGDSYFVHEGGWLPAQYNNAELLLQRPWKLLLLTVSPDEHEMIKQQLESVLLHTDVLLEALSVSVLRTFTSHPQLSPSVDAILVLHAADGRVLLTDQVFDAFVLCVSMYGQAMTRFLVHRTGCTITSSARVSKQRSETYSWRLPLFGKRTRKLVPLFAKIYSTRRHYENLLTHVARSRFGHSRAPRGSSRPRVHCYHGTLTHCGGH
jgi:hypothetical protein